jgi:hypothetical protein
MRCLARWLLSTTLRKEVLEGPIQVYERLLQHLGVCLPSGSAVAWPDHAVLALCNPPVVDLPAMSELFSQVLLLLLDRIESLADDHGLIGSSMDCMTTLSDTVFTKTAVCIPSSSIPAIEDG